MPTPYAGRCTSSTRRRWRLPTASSGGCLGTHSTSPGKTTSIGSWSVIRTGCGSGGLENGNHRHRPRRDDRHRRVQHGYWPVPVRLRVHGDGYQEWAGEVGEVLQPPTCRCGIRLRGLPVVSPESTATFVEPPGPRPGHRNGPGTGGRGSPVLPVGQCYQETSDDSGCHAWT